MDFQSYLSQQYQGHESFIENIIIPIFGEENYDTAYDVELLDSEELRNQAVRTGIHSIIRCGTIDLDLTPIEVFDITVSDRILMDKNRVGVQAVIRRVMDTYSGAFMIIHYKNDVKWDWRFTFCQMKDKGEFTDNKRYTFLLGPNQSCRTAAQNFQKLADLHENITIKDIVSAFDVEALSKSFFDGYKKHYEKFVEFITGKRFVKVSGKFVERTSHKPHPMYYPAFGRDDKAVRDYTKILLARIVFLHFLQKKGWLGVPVDGKWGDGDEQFMKHLYERASDEQKNDYLESVLEPLFFDALNGDRTSSKDVFDTKVVGKVRIPYLNGGLFSRDSLDEIVIRYPKEFFGDFLEFLYQYNFTIDENDPHEAQVGIDPEMLGKIFENLLEDNKDKGAYYTPKEIVQYMSQESLIAYLVTRTGYADERLRAFVKDPFVRVSEFTPDEQYAILGAILTVKICDPAIGSGAFPIGLLNELVRCKEAIYGDEKGRAEIKKEIIRDNIYGVDIEKGAVDIARLRFWLSLIVDEREPLPLPNLDYKIMQGNSLLEWYDGVDLSHLVDAGETDVFLSGAESLKDDLAKLLKSYFDETVQKKKTKEKERISKTIEKILEVAGVSIPEGIDVADNNQFFLWHTWFNEVFAEGGFDICIGNPPYGAKITEEEKAIYKRIYSTSKTIKGVQKGSMDTYTLFIERGFNLIRENGNLIFIVPMSFTSSDSLVGVHRLLLSTCDTIRVSSYAVRPQPVFENAVVNTSIVQFVKTNTPCKRLYATKMHRKGQNFDLDYLIRNLKFADVGDFLMAGRIPKISEPIERVILRKLFKFGPLESFKRSRGKSIYYRSTGGRYFKVVTNYSTGSSKEKELVLDKKYADAIGCILSSNLAFWFYQIYSNNLDWRDGEISAMPIPILSSSQIYDLKEKYKEYLSDIEKNVNVRNTTEESKYQMDSFKEYKIVKSKSIIDEIDDLIGPIYGLSETEVSFIKNYELGFRLAGDD